MPVADLLCYVGSVRLFLLPVVRTTVLQWCLQDPNSRPEKEGGMCRTLPLLFLHASPPFCPSAPPTPAHQLFAPSAFLEMCPVTGTGVSSITWCCTEVDLKRSRWVFWGSVEQQPADRLWLGALLVWGDRCWCSLGWFAQHMQPCLQSINFILVVFFSFADTGSVDLEWSLQGSK